MTQSIPDPPLPPTSLIICTRNRPQFLSELMDSVLGGDELPSEIVVVDDSDAPHPTLGELQAPPGTEIRYHWTHAAGLGRANNDGVALARHDLLVFTQDDVLVAPEWFGTLARAQVAAGPGIVVTGRVLPGEPEEAGAFAPSTISDEQPRTYEGRIGIDVLFLQNMAIYRSLVKAVGGFDSRLGPGTPYPGAEDNDFAFRLLEAGYRIRYEPRAVTRHRAWRPARTYASLCWNYGCGQGGYYAKHLSLRDRYMLRRMLVDVGRQGRLAARGLLRRPRKAVGHAATMLGVLYGMLRWWTVERGTTP